MDKFEVPMFDMVTAIFIEPPMASSGKEIEDSLSEISGNPDISSISTSSINIGTPLCSVSRAYRQRIYTLSPA